MDDLDKRLKELHFGWHGNGQHCNGSDDKCTLMKVIREAAEITRDHFTPTVERALVDVLPQLERLGDLDGNGPTSEEYPLGTRCHAMLEVKAALRMIRTGGNNDGRSR